MTKILGVDLGTNGIGVAVVDSQTNKIELVSSRIIPMDAEMLGNFDKGNTVSQTASRRGFRSVRRLGQRHLLRRERLHRVLHILGFLPEHYACQIDFETHYGQIKPEKEPKIAWRKIEATGDYEFIFKPSFQGMIADFRENQPSIFSSKSDGSQSLVPYDWTIYYLRKKALRQAITKEELAWLLLNFNKKRGYYQLRGEDEDEEVSDKKVEYCKLKVVSVEATDDKKGNDIWYNVHLENGWIYRRSSGEPLDWVGKVKEFIVTTALEKDGTPKLNKEGQVNRSFRAPKETDWTLVKKRTESELEDSGKTVGQFIYDTLLQIPNQKIKGQLVSVIERKYYKDELTKILEKQKEFHPELTSKTMLEKSLLELYKNNENHRRNLENKDLCNLLLNDIIFYQRPLKSKKSLIANCKYEENHYMKDGQLKTMPLKVMPCSNPFYQEFRLWKFVSDLRIYCYDELLCQESDVTDEQIKDKAKLYKLLNDKSSIDQKGCLKVLGIKDTKLEKYTWNYDDTRVRPCNETRGLILEALRKKKVESDFMNDPAAEYALWHILYSVTDKTELEGALGKFAARYKIDAQTFTDALRRIKPFPSDYGSYSEKACKRILPLMRVGEFWSPDNIHPMVRERIDKIINGEFDALIDDRTREKCAALTNIKDFCGLPEWLASYVAYGRHAEAKDIDKWTKPEDIDLYLKHFKQHSMRNPIVEQVVIETLRTVRDVWKQVGQIDEIHVELGREMKKTAAQRKKLSEFVAKNEDTNIRIKMLLQEFVNPEYDISGVRPYSPSQQSILRIYEEEALNYSGEVPEYVDQVLKKFKEHDVKKQPSKSEVMRYKLWLEQKCRSPYTGNVISLSGLFTSAYEIEHVIPKARFFDDSLSNKVVCEREVNKLKGNYLARNFIEKKQGDKVKLSGRGVVSILSADAYDKFVKDRYKSNKPKLQKLLMTEIPDGFNKRQLNDTRYISRFITGLLSNIVREEGEIDAISKNVIPCNGGITDRLKQEWGLNDVWNDIVYPRFERLNSLTQSRNFGEWTNKEGKRVFQTQVPVELSKGFSKKRIDHRHHALDAITIACATRSHVNYLNNVNARSDNRTTGKTFSDSDSLKGLRYDLKHKLCYKFKLDDNGEYQWRFHKPWDTFTQDTRQAIQGIVVGFKQNLRVINKATNSTLHYNEEGKKELRKQDGLNWAIRKSMHKDTVFGQVNLRFTKFVRVGEALGNYKVIVDQSIKRDVERMIMEGLDSKVIIKSLKDQGVSKIEVYYFSDETSTKFGATRKSLDDKFDAKKIETVTDTGIRKILMAHLKRCEMDPKKAFSADGIAQMNAQIITLNAGKAHQPIYKVRLYEPLGAKFAVGTTGNKSRKFVEADKGTNLFFAIYVDNQGVRSYESVPLNVVIERQKQGLLSAPERDEKGNELLYTLSPNDLVYLPTPDQLGRPIALGDIDRQRIYKMLSCTGTSCLFLPHSVSNVIVGGVEFQALNKVERALTGEMIKASCIPLKVDRLGNIVNLLSKDCRG